MLGLIKPDSKQYPGYVGPASQAPGLCSPHVFTLCLKNITSFDFNGIPANSIHGLMNTYTTEENNTYYICFLL